MPDSRVQHGNVLAVARDSEHRFSKPVADQIVLVAGLGVQGDTHSGVTVQHRSRVAVDPSQPNLRQVHLIHGELYDELRAAGYDVSHGQLGENVTTRGLNLLGLPRGAILHIGEDAVVQVTGLRNPCKQISAFAPGMLKSVLGRDEHGNLVRKAGVMGVVRHGGTIIAGAPITVQLPTEPHRPLEPV